VLISLRVSRLVLDRAGLGWLAGGASLLVAERALLGLGALSAARGAASGAALAVGLLGGLAAFRGLLRAPLLARVRQRLVSLVASALLARGLSRPSPVSVERLEIAVFEGLSAAESVATGALPDLCAEAVAGGVLLAMVAPLLGAELLAMGAAALCVGGAVAELGRRVSEREARRGWAAFEPVGEAVYACIHGAADLVGNGRAAAHEAASRAAAAGWARASLRADAVAGLMGRLPLLAAAGVAMVALLARDGHGAGGALAAFSSAVLLLSLVPPMAGVARNLIELGRSRARLEPLLALLAAGRPPPPGGAEPVLPSRITWRGVSFSYALPDGSTSTPALRGLDLVWEPGELLALAGPNGAGKSTVLRLLLGLCRPSEGEVTIGGAPLGSLDLSALRRRAAYVPQRPFLPERASVREAIALLAPSAGDAEMRGALERVGLWGRVAPEGLSRPVSALSAGERQRLCLARALCQEASLLLLDEPDANLDAEGVALVAGLLAELAQGRMVIVVAHSPQLLAAAGRVVHVRAGAQVVP
jgi:ATP-binding cassette, subfamily C, bacterial CydD